MCGFHWNPKTQKVKTLEIPWQKRTLFRSLFTDSFLPDRFLNKRKSTAPIDRTRASFSYISSYLSLFWFRISFKSKEITIKTQIIAQKPDMKNPSRPAFGSQCGAGLESIFFVIRRYHGIGSVAAVVVIGVKIMLLNWSNGLLRGTSHRCPLDINQWHQNDTTHDYLGGGAGRWGFWFCGVYHSLSPRYVWITTDM